MSELDDPRVLFSAERTLLAWNRTSLSLMAFGFVIERSGFLMGPPREAGTRLPPTFWLGILFILLAAVTAAWSARQYAAVLRSLTPSEFPPGYSARWGLSINIITAVLGILLLGVMVLGGA